MENDFFTEVCEALGHSDPTMKQIKTLQALFDKYYGKTFKGVAAPKTKRAAPRATSMTLTKYVSALIKDEFKSPQFEDCFNLELNLDIDDYNTIFKTLSEIIQKAWDDLSDESKETIVGLASIKELIAQLTLDKKVFKLAQTKSIVVAVLNHLKFKIPADFSLTGEEDETPSSPVAAPKKETASEKQVKQRKPKDTNKRGLEFFRKFISAANNNEKNHVFEQDVSHIAKFYQNYKNGGTPLIKLNNMFNTLPSEYKVFYNNFFESYPELTEANTNDINERFATDSDELIAKFEEFFLSATGETTDAGETDNEVAMPPPPPKKISTKKV